MKFSIYKNDLRYKKYRGIDEKKIKELFPNQTFEDTDTIEYRMNEYDGEILDISHLDLREFPEKIPVSVRYLFCSDNNFEVIEDISHLTNLEVFDCCSNKLKKLPKLPKNIVEISCRNNLIEDISEICNYQKLKRLDISYNVLEYISAHDTLEILVCSYNKIRFVPSFDKLKKLICNDNQINKIEPLLNIEILDCHNNQLTKIGDFPKLKELYCENNKITTIDKIDCIEIIECYNNKLTTLSYFKYLKELVCDYNDKFFISKNYKIKETFLDKKNILYIKFE